MFLRNKIFRLIIYIFFILQISMGSSLSKDMNAQEIYNSCKNYYEWVNKNYAIPIDEKVLFNMGKCQGTIETLGKTMLTLCYESKRNVNINKGLTANLEGIKTIDIIENFLQKAFADGKLRSYSSHSYLLSFISKKWPCK